MGEGGQLLAEYIFFFLLEDPYCFIILLLFSTHVAFHFQPAGDSEICLCEQAQISIDSSLNDSKRMLYHNIYYNCVPLHP